MISNLKRILIFALIFSMLVCALNSCATPQEPHETDTECEIIETTSEVPMKKTLDIYLVAGQSNATGCTKVTDLGTVYDFYPDLVSGVSNVLYAGNSRANGTNPKDRVLGWQETMYGLGMSENHIGPEAGMAKALSEYYNKQTGKYAGIIKYAYGGSSLLNYTSGDTNKGGNWASPSYQATLSPSEIVDGVTGQLYKNFLDQVKTNITEALNGEGVMGEYAFEGIRICGLYWMQGCNNKNEPSKYDTAFKYFAEDIRRDLSKMMKEFSGSEDDFGASEMPIIIGTISETQAATAQSVITTNRTFIAMQKALASKIKNCYVVDNSAYAICKWENGSMKIVGSDEWHWNQADMLAIGKNVGDLMLEVAIIKE